MELLRCTQCKGDLQLSEDGLFGRCIFCGATYHFKNEKNARLISLLNQANISRLKGDYESAILAYQIALKEDETDADAYWGVVLSTYGIDYVEDKNGKLVPTCRRTVKNSILDDLNYKNAIKYASEQQAKQFEVQAKEIDDLQNRIKQKIQYEQDYDVFICFKSTDDENNPTRDRFIARQIYDELTKRNIRAFNSEISLKDRIGEDYEPIIYKALYTCKYFILVATKPEFIQASWVRNEWTRFRDRAQEEKLENCAFVVFDNIKENEVPPIFRKQGIDLSKYPAGGYEVEIADGLQLKLKQNTDSKEYIAFEEEKIVDIMDKRLQGTRETFKERLDRAIGYYEIGNREKAFDIIDEAIDYYPRKSSGWWTKVKFLTDDFNCDIVSVCGNDEYKKQILANYENACRFANLKEKELYSNESKQFFEKLTILERVEQLLTQSNKEIELLYDTQQQIDNLEKGEVKARDINNLKRVLNFNNDQIADLSKRLKKKSYYIKNMPKEKRWIHGFLNFTSFALCITSIVFVAIEIGKGATVPELVAGGAVIASTLLPALIAKISERRLRFKKSSKTIEADENRLKNLIEENKFIQDKLTNNISQSDKQAKFNILQEEQQRIDGNIESIKNELEEHIKNDYVKKYIDKFESKFIASVDNQIFDNIEKINEFETECEALRQSNNKKIELIKKNKPKYYDSKYELQKLKNNKYIIENQKYIEMVDNEIDKIENEIKLLNYKKENNLIKKINIQEDVAEFNQLDNEVSDNLINENLVVTQKEEIDSDSENTVYDEINNEKDDNINQINDNEKENK